MYRRRIMLSKKAEKLPIGVTELRWIESNGNQYIDTGRMVGSKDRLFFLFNFNLDAANQEYALGWLKEDENGCCVFGKSLEQTLRIGSTDYILPEYYMVLDIDFKEKTVKMLGNNLDIQADWDKAFDEDGNAGLNMFLFAANKNGCPSYGSYTLLEYTHFNEFGGRVQHLVPVLDESLRPCLYDFVSKKFYYNANKESAIDFEYEE